MADRKTPETDAKRTAVSDGVAELLESEAIGHWVSIDVAIEALGLGQRRVYQLAKSEGWRVTVGYPRQYAFADIRTTYRRLNPSRSTK